MVTNNKVSQSIVKCVTALIPSFVVLSYLYLYEFRGLGAIFLLTLVTFFDLFLIIFGIVKYRKSKSTKLIIWGLCIFLSNWTAPFFVEPIHDYELTITKERGDAIIIELEKYYQDKKSYPRELNELTKKYSFIVPKTYHITAKEEEFEYYLDEHGGYVLSYSTDPYRPMRYYSKDKQWHFQPLG